MVSVSHYACFSDAENTEIKNGFLIKRFRWDSLLLKSIEFAREVKKEKIFKITFIIEKNTLVLLSINKIQIQTFFFF